ncbi:hypothetical protein AVEN_28977-1 [Araneus ventricosus]|uniref:Uncharacterized protein n=1 Tax=Araneus ventricosus TaxID=182803 RepID=A0A4Y2AL03_ARAVE|nr:hypothetical protein AVEN_28977-1 [Araneus ventricosus]
MQPNSIYRIESWKVGLKQTENMVQLLLVEGNSKNLDCSLELTEKETKTNLSEIKGKESKNKNSPRRQEQKSKHFHKRQSSSSTSKEIDLRTMDPPKGQEQLSQKAEMKSKCKSSFKEMNQPEVENMDFLESLERALEDTEEAQTASINKENLEDAATELTQNKDSSESHQQCLQGCQGESNSKCKFCFKEMDQAEKKSDSTENMDSPKKQEENIKQSHKRQSSSACKVSCKGLDHKHTENVTSPGVADCNMKSPGKGELVSTSKSRKQSLKQTKKKDSPKKKDKNNRLHKKSPSNADSEELDGKLTDISKISDHILKPVEEVKVVSPGQISPMDINTKQEKHKVNIKCFSIYFVFA